VEGDVIHPPQLTTDKLPRQDQLANLRDPRKHMLRRVSNNALFHPNDKKSLAL